VEQSSISVGSHTSSTGLGFCQEDRLGANRSGRLPRWYDHASRPSKGGWPSAGTPRSQVRDIPDSVSFRPVGRVRTALLGTSVRVSR
jgi:hypothetical protein